MFVLPSFLQAARLLVVLGAATALAQDVYLNEYRLDEDGDDQNEYVELRGTPGEDLNDCTFIILGDGTGGSGVIESITPLTGEFLGSNGLLLIYKSTLAVALVNQIESGTTLVQDDGMSLENSDNVNYLLVRDFSGTSSQDLDTDDDGVLDVEPWSEVVSCIGIKENDSGEKLYCSEIIGPDGSSVPAHSYVCVDSENSDLPGYWTIGDFDPIDNDTPGRQNAYCPLSVAPEPQPEPEPEPEPEPAPEPEPEPEPEGPPRSCENVESSYGNIRESMQGNELKRALHNLIANHTVMTYDEVGDQLNYLDVPEGGDGNFIRDIYGSLDNLLPTCGCESSPCDYNGNSCIWNREHVWSRSFGLGNSGPDYSDVLADPTCTSDECECSELYPDCDYPGYVSDTYSGGPGCADTIDLWTPPIQSRGLVARAVMYMSTRYDGSDAGTEDLELVELPFFVNDVAVNTYEEAQGYADSGSSGASNSWFLNLNTLLEWHEAYPPDAYEIRRNNLICANYQHNRNPFIDHPEYAMKIWRPEEPPSAIIGDPHFGCPSGSHFNFDGTQVPGRKEYYSLLLDPATGLQANVELSTVAYANSVRIHRKMAQDVIKMDKLFTHVTKLGLFDTVSGLHAYIIAKQHEEDASKSLQILVNNVAIPSEHTKGLPLSKDGVSNLNITQSPCQFMKPMDFVAAKGKHQRYQYETTRNNCTTLELTMGHFLSLRILHVPAVYEDDNVGHNYLNVMVTRWTHSTLVGGLLSHCFGAPIAEGCPQCFQNALHRLNDIKVTPPTDHAKKAPGILTTMSGTALAVGDSSEDTLASFFAEDSFFQDFVEAMENSYGNTESADTTSNDDATQTRFPILM